MVRPRLSVIFVNNDDVQQITTEVNQDRGILIPLHERRQNQLKNGLSRRESHCEPHELSPVQEVDEDTTHVFSKPTELLKGEEGMVRGSIAFGFHTPKKRGGMMEKAGCALTPGSTMASPSTPRTPSQHQYRIGIATPRTPKTPNTPKTPKTPMSSKRTPQGRRLSEISEAATPYSFRRRVKQRITKIAQAEDSSSSDDNWEGSDSESEDDDSYDSDSDDDGKENIYREKTGRTPIHTPRRTPTHTPRRTPSRKPQTPSHTPRRTPGKGTPSRHGQSGVKGAGSSHTPAKTPSRAGRGNKVKDVEMVAKSDDYFKACHDVTKTSTSDHTLSRLSTPRLAPEMLQSILSGMNTTHHDKERQALSDDCALVFSRWIIYLCEGFSIFLYGLGSKKQVISEFQEQYLSEYDHIVVNGFFPSLTLKSILNHITDDILEYNGSFHSIQDQLDFLDHTYSNPSTDPLFILIHNLDGAMLRGEKTQGALARLANVQNIHILASVDHINAPLLLDSKKMSLYNAVWFDATTFEQYREETSYENSLLVQQSSSLALSSLIHVFKSLTPNAKGIFMLLAKHQLDQKDNTNYSGMSFSDLYQRCRESFLVNSDLTLRAQLTEFRDHKLLKSRKGYDGVENLTIPLEANTLQDFVNQQELEGTA